MTEDTKSMILRLYYENKSALFIDKSGVIPNYSAVLKAIANYIVKDLVIIMIDAVDSCGEIYEGVAGYMGRPYYFHSSMYDGADTHEQSAAIDIICQILKEEINVDLWEEEQQKESKI